MHGLYEWDGKEEVKRQTNRKKIKKKKGIAKNTKRNCKKEKMEGWQGS